MQQIADWLKTLGLEQYAQRFAENDINFAILSDLTDQDLKELGVSSLGHRRQLLRAIAELNGVEKGAPKLAPATAVPVTPQPHDAAERRQVTVMFSRSRRLDGAFRPHGPGGPARGHFHLSEVRRRDRAPFRRLRRQIHGRRRADLFRLSAGA